MTLLPKTTVTALTLVLLSSPGCFRKQLTQQDEIRVIGQVSTVSPALREFAEVYPHCSLFVSYLDQSAGQPTLNAVVIAEKRYEFVLQIPLTMDASAQNIDCGSPSYTLSTIDTVEDRGGGVVAVSYSGPTLRFGYDTWTTFRSKTNDYRALGIIDQRTNAIDNIDAYIKRVRMDHTLNGAH